MKRQRVYCYLLLLLLAVLLTACSDKDNNHIYVAEKISILGGVNNTANFKAKDGYLYYQQENMVYRLPAEDLLAGAGEALLQREDVFTGSTAGGTLCAYTLDGEGCGYYALMDSLWTGEIQGSALVKQQADGTELYRLDLESLNLLGASLAVDGKGRAFLLTGDSLYVADAEGKLIVQISGSKLGAEFYSGQGRLLEGENGSIYYSPSDYGNVVYEISGNDATFRRENLQMKQIKFPCTTGKCYSAQQGLLCAGKDGILYQYHGSKWKTLLRYVDSSLQMQPYQMLQFSEEWMAAYYNDYVSDAMYFLTKTDASLLERDETELVLVASALTDELDHFITTFNRTSGYHITVEYYQGEDRVNRLDAKMVSSHPPDMIVLEDETALKFSEKNMLEDLTPYLEASHVLNREDFLENLLEGYTLSGRLVCIPDTFYINLAIGRTSHVGTHTGWTSEDVMALAETYPTAQLFKTPTFTSMTAFFWKDILTRYVDWESGECSFDGEDFRAFAEWMKAHSNGFGSGYAYDFGDSWDSSQEAVPDGQLLCPNSSILYDFSSLLSDELCFGESITAIGYPTFDGRPYYIGRASSAIGITTNSKNKEAAWQFIEAFLSRDSNYSRQLPTRRELLAQKVDAEMTPNYWRDEAGEIIYTEPDNEPGMNAKSWIVVGDERIPYYYVTKEQADMVMEIVETADFTPIYGGLWHNVINILLEEMEPYVDGQRSLEESTRILQNRVRNLVQENM